jgi:F0F1-type ATP synthase membrane subunit c/vacuolar-type H+-ATPase subunit K
MAAKNESTSNNNKLIVLLCTFLASFLVGLILYLCLSKDMNDSDKKTCRTVLIVLGIIQLVLIIAVVVL